MRKLLYFPRRGTVMLFQILGASLLIAALAACAAVVLYRRSRRPARGDPAPAVIPLARVADGDFQRVHLELTVQLAYAAARADGRVARNERALIARHVEQHYGHDPALLDYARGLCARYERTAPDVDECLTRVVAACTPPIRRGLLELCRQVAEATNGINQREDAFLTKLAGRLLAEPAPPAAVPVAAPTRDEHRAALEIDAALPLTADLVRRQYRLLHERYAPEKVHAMGADFQEMARRKRDAAHAAAAALLAEMGEPLETAPPAAAPADLRHNPDLDALFGA